MRRRLADERGFTLVELIVGMASGTVLIAAAFLLVQVAVKTQVDASSRVEALQLGRAAVNDITRSLRAQTCLGDGSPSFLAGSDTSVQLYTSVASAQTDYQRVQRRTITFVPDATGDKGRIEETTQLGVGRPPDVTSWNAAETRVIANGVKLISGTPFFRYYTFTGSPASATLLLTTPLSAGDLYRVVRVQVAFQTSTDRVSQDLPSLRFENAATARTADPDAQEGTLPCV